MAVAGDDEDVDIFLLVLVLLLVVLDWWLVLYWNADNPPPLGMSLIKLNGLDDIVEAIVELDLNPKTLLLVLPPPNEAALIARKIERLFI